MKADSLWISQKKDDVLWESKTQERKLGDQKIDVLIIGAGIAGILCAYQLKQAGICCMVVEQGEICGKVTQNTTAKVTVQHGLVYQKILKRYGLERAKEYYMIQKRALDVYKTLVQKFPCDWEEKTAYVYTKDAVEKLEKEQDAYEKIGIPYCFQENVPLPFQTKGAIGLGHQGCFHPLRFLQALSKDLPIVSHTPVLELDGKCAKTPFGTIHADRIVLATHFPMVNVRGLYMMKLYQHRSYVAALENGVILPGMYVDEDKTGFSFRNYGRMLLVGGGGHRTGKAGGGYQAVYDFVQEKYPESKIVYTWATQDCMTLDDIPYIGVHSKGMPYLYVSTGFQKWGMTNAMAAAIVLRDCIVKGECEYEKLFSPSRSMFHIQLPINLAVSTADFLAPGKRCSHLGCSLKWNPQEHTWDCPCHGSRFQEDGRVLDNPAKKNLKG